MLPTKRSNSSSLIICAAPAKKVPEPPVSNDDSKKPPILKALEAVVAAGRLGLLGPTAMAAVEAMPDLEVQSCDGKVGQGTPSSIPLLGEKEEEKAGKEEGRKERKEEEKIVNKEGNTDVAVTPPVNGTGSSSCTIKDIWICGDYVISLSKRRSQFSVGTKQLGFSASVAYVTWRGIPTMKWDDLLPNLHQLYHQCRFPSIIVIHLGENDLRVDSSHSLVTKMQNDLVILQKAFQDVVIIWSSLLPKGVWKLSKKVQVLESKRNDINCKMEEFCNENGMHYFLHPLLTHPLFIRQNQLFTRQNTLSKQGADVFITGLRQFLSTFLNCD
ncbi:PREDICTED: uncharacterized protein LOC107120502 [Gekko japonicus]|uniref:Uncharacterized protein LOC107120502 n=1 Tax=Gekko japonicus TaxID=146911 RepID=A0ABM1KYB7_GEKJA|nr:PREDICTED: uncharacterized protein LOC107120502 [Gekko japonicus]